MYHAAMRNTWTVEEVDFSTDAAGLATKLTAVERYLVQRLVAEQNYELLGRICQPQKMEGLIRP
jgi:ribonucleotide reductase beta subunit family protein with ferritin-like domain